MNIKSIDEIAPPGKNRNASKEKIKALLRQPVSESEVNSATEKILEVIQGAWNLYHEEGIQKLYEHLSYQKCDNAYNNLKDKHLTSDQDDSNIDHAKIKGDAREYQVEFFKRAVEKNTIVNLTTGAGKTLIGIMAIRKFGDSTFGVPFQKNIVKGIEELQHTNSNNLHTKELKHQQQLYQQIWFLVPSIALAVQQSSTLRANLPYTVATACHTAVCSEKSRSELALAQIVVTTHGCALDLLRHYSDIFTLERVSLLCIDECHYAAKKHGYAVLMEKFYHKLDEKKRPRILGLTASPLINVRKKEITQTELETMLCELESTLDSTLVSLSSLGLGNESGVVKSIVKESVVHYDNDLSNADVRLPTHEGVMMHRTREKEVDQLTYLLHEFGPLLVGVYTHVLVEEVSRNRYEKETLEQYNIFLQHLKNIIQQCEILIQSSRSSNYGKSDKLVKLETMLANYFNGDSNETVGILFVERRITALALKCYFSHEQSSFFRDTSLITVPLLGNGMIEPTRLHKYMRCDILTRRTTHVFKYLNACHQLSSEQEENAHKDWLHRMQNTKEVLDKLRRREINLLIATSVVEEGVDVDACEFVIVLDNLKTTKSYIQTKGRARMICAKFVVFENVNVHASSPPVTIDHARDTEKKIIEYIGARTKVDDNITSRIQDLPNMNHIESSSTEIDALNEGEFRSLNGMVDLSSAKSLVNRYSSCIPMDITSRSSRKAMQPYQPLYQNRQLILPAHLPENLRFIYLPPNDTSLSKKDREARLALIACVRLHHYGVLNDRLLPLKREDIYKRLLSSALFFLPSVDTKAKKSTPPTSGDGKKVFVYPLKQRGHIFDQHDSILSNQSRCLCIVTLRPLHSIPSFELYHSQLSKIHCQFGTEKIVDLNSEQWSICTMFYSVIINSRWSRRTGRKRFRYSGTTDGTISPYAVACMTKEHHLDWIYMQKVLDESKRDEKQRKLAAQSSTAKFPRLWNPIYDPNNTYISFFKSGETCSSPFPNNKFENYKDYFLQQRSFNVELESSLYNVQRQWHLPNNMKDVKNCSHGPTSKRKIETESEEHNEIAPLYNLDPVMLPQDACMEADPVADAALSLHCVMLPQILYQLDRYESTLSFIAYCVDHFPEPLGRCLSHMPIDNVIEALTANSCTLDFSYDRLEYLGDAVLKLLQTDALINSQDENLKNWICCLHEGDLSLLRSAMGSNDRLKDVAQSAGFSTFILTKALGRGVWVPSGLEPYINQIEDEDCDVLDFKPSHKVQADVIESLLGLVYLYSGIETTKLMSEQLGILTREGCEPSVSITYKDVHVGKELINFANLFLDKAIFSHVSLLKEALTHPSLIHSEVPSYQRLEWIGDAVLCLAAREWVFKTYLNLSVKHLVVMETSLVCNETLALLGHLSGAHKFIDHCDATMPSRLEDYKLRISGIKGLWVTNPPKVIADVVEAMIGAAHCDGGFEDGQKSALFVIKPMTSAFVDNQVSNPFERIGDNIVQPKQAMTELCASLKVRSLDQHKFSLNFSKCPIWKNELWGHNSADGSGYIGQVTWFGKNLVAVVDNNSAVVAKNRACAMITLVLKKNPELRAKFLELTNKLKDMRID